MYGSHCYSTFLPTLGVIRLLAEFLPSEMISSCGFIWNVSDYEWDWEPLCEIHFFLIFFLCSFILWFVQQAFLNCLIVHFYPFLLLWEQKDNFVLHRLWARTVSCLPMKTQICIEPSRLNRNRESRNICWMNEWRLQFIPSQNFFSYGMPSFGSTPFKREVIRLAVCF